MNNAKTGQFISEKRKALGLTQQELAEKLQITNKAVSKWETGDGMPDVQLLSPLAKELGTTVDEILNGEEKITEEKPSPLVMKYSYDLPVGVVVTCLLTVVSAFYNVMLCVSQIFNGAFLSIYGDSFVLRLPHVLVSAGFGLYWVIVSIIFVCRFLKIFDYKFKLEKTLTIVAFIVGFIMLFAQGLDYSPINYGLFMFSFALLFGTFHGYRVPHKIFFGLAILFTFIFGIPMIFSEGGTDSIQIYAFVRRLVIALAFYIFYGLLEKFSSEYEGVEE